MTETSGASFSGFDSEEILNLPATEVVSGAGTAAPTTCFNASASQGEAMSRQVSTPVPPRGDSQADQATLIRDLIRDELRKGLGHRSHHSQRQGSASSSSSQEGSRSSRSRSVSRSRSPSWSHRSRSHSRRSSCSHAPSRSSLASGGSFRAHPSLSRHSLVTSPALTSRRVTPSATVASSYVRHASGARSPPSCSSS